MALGIIAFALIPLFSLVPMGLNTFRSSMDRSVSARITQQIISKARQTEFENLTALKSLRYFTDEGDETTATSSTKIYIAQTNVEMQVVIPGSELFSNPSIAKVRVKVIHSPAGDESVFNGNGRGFDDFTAFISKM